MTTTSIQTRLVVRDAPAAIDLYRTALGAEEVARFTDPSGRVVHAELRIGETILAVTEEDGVHATSPHVLGGSCVHLGLTVADADAVGAALEAAGAEVVFPIEDRFYGRREGRLRDPFGHLWMVGQPLEDLPADEIQRRMEDATAG